MPAPNVDQVRAWLGRVMVDRDGNRLGEITDIYLDRETDRPEWAVVRTGLFGLRSSFVPLAEAREIDDQIQIPHERTLVKDAPNIEADGQLSEAEEAELYRHYGLDYDTVTPDSDHAAQRRSSEEPAATDTMGSTQPVTEEGLGTTDEGVSRPFVYETPRRRPGSPWQPTAAVGAGAAAPVSGHRGGDRDRDRAATRAAGGARTDQQRRGRRRDGPCRSTRSIGPV